MTARIDEISAVDRPAQEGAMAVMLKRAPDENDAAARAERVLKAVIDDAREGHFAKSLTQPTYDSETYSLAMELFAKNDQQDDETMELSYARNWNHPAMQALGAAYAAAKARETGGSTGSCRSRQ